MLADVAGSLCASGTAEGPELGSGPSVLLASYLTQCRAGGASSRVLLSYALARWRRTTVKATIRAIPSRSAPAAAQMASIGAS
jgi:hypothetical protein